MSDPSPADPSPAVPTVDPPVPAALRILQTLLNDNDIPEDLASSLKSKYQQLHESVLNSIENERALLSKAQSLNESLLDTQREVESKTKSVLHGDSELEALSVELERSSIAQQELETQIDMAVMERESVDRNKVEIEAEIVERRKKSSELLEPILSRLNAEIEGLTEEIASIKQQVEAECTVRDQYGERIAECTESLQELERKKLHKRQRLIRQKSEPERLEIQCQVLLRNADILRKKNEARSAELDAVKSSMAEMAASRSEVDAERYGLAERLMRLRDGIDKKERDIDEVTRRVEHSKHRIEDAQDLQLTLTVEVNQLKSALKREGDTVTKLGRVVEDKKRKYEVLRRSREAMKAAILPLEEEADRCLKRREDVEAEGKRQSKVVVELREDIDIVIAAFLSQEDAESAVKAQLLTLRETMALRESVMASNRKKERLLREKLRELSLEREQLLSAGSSASGQIHSAKQRVKVKEILVMDQKKRGDGVVLKLKECRKQYEMMKNSRNRYANLVQNTFQALSEMKEKMKIVDNELEILRNENVSKETALIEERRILTAAQYTRDQLRFELNKAHHVLADKRALTQRYTMDINKLEITIKQIDAEMACIAQKYEVALKDRNRSGLLLMDRNDELSILNEKRNVLQSVLSRGDQMIKERDEEGKRIKLATEDLRRSLEVARKRLPSDEQQRESAKTYCDLEARLKETRALSKRLSEELQVPNPSINPTRYRKIAGNDPGHNQLQSNIAVLCSRLTAQKEQLLEKELILEEVGGLTDKLRLQALEGHDITLLLAKKMNSLQHQVKKVTRGMMATVSELSMYQATTIRLEAEKDALHAVIVEGQLLLNQQQAPFEQAQLEWANMERNRMRNIDHLHHHLPSSRGINHRDWTPSYDYTADQHHDAHSANGPGNTSSAGGSKINSKTTAEPRPNAYIADDIGIPKPYGAHAPFKPTPLGANLRHIKKPQPRQVII